MISAIDTNILLDVLGNDAEFGKDSAELLERQSQLGNLIISPIVYSELLVFFLKKDAAKAISELEEFLKDLIAESKSKAPRSIISRLHQGLALAHQN